MKLTLEQNDEISGYELAAITAGHQEMRQLLC